MLKGSFYNVQSKVSGEKDITARVEFNSAHAIFSGHFPGQPVVPGVCMIQIVKDFVEERLGKKLMLQDGDNIKFLAVIDPRDNPVVDVKISFEERPDSVAVNASLFSGSQTFFKLKGSYSS